MKKMSDQELESLLDDCESDLVERKQSFKGDTPKKARQAVCAFSNDLPNYNKPGILFIGAKDDGAPSGEAITDELLRALADMKTDGNILSSPTFSVEKRILKGAEMAIVIVMPSDMPPVRYDGRIWIRIGPRRAIANEQEERILSEKRRHKNLPFDLYPFPPAKLEDLSRLIFENAYLPAAFANDVLEANGRSYEERLAACKMILSPEDTTPTILGLLAIGKNPQDFLADAYIQFLRIDGTELADPVVDEEKIGGALVDMLRRIEEKLTAHNRTAFDVTSMPTHIQTSLYPAAAMHQVIYNAVLHRTYEGVRAPVHVYWFNDRIEISSPGGPYGNVTEKNFGKPGIVSYRNPNIGDVLKIFGFIQAFGRGIAIARQALEKNGNPPPEFEVDQNRVLCVIRKKP